MTLHLHSRLLLAVLFCAVTFGVSTSQAQITHPMAPPPAITATQAAPPPANHQCTPPIKPIIPVAQPPQILSIYSHGDPTDEEQYMLELINRARSDPNAEGIRLSTTTDPDVSGSYDYFKTPTRSQVAADFSTMTPKAPLAFNAKLINAARLHSQDMLANNFQSHTGSNGSTLPQRTSAAGYTSGYVGENIFAYTRSVFHAHASFLIDFGNDATLGHRKNIMNYDGTGIFYTEIGVGMIHGSNGGVGPIITTEDFGNADKHFITGVAYDDANSNGFYDMGEGLAGITITPSSGSSTAVTSSSGGYAIPMADNAGTVSVTATGTGLGTVSHQIDFGSENVKMDFTKDISGYPAQVQITYPLSGQVVKKDTVVFTWDAADKATKYHIQIATDAAMTKLILNDATITTTSKKFGPLKQDSTYYWRVQAINGVGAGQYSAIASFTVVIPPPPLAKVPLVFPKDAEKVGYPLTITLVWNSVSDDPLTGYWIEVATDKAMTTHIVNDNTLFYYDTTFTISQAELLANTTYYWRVRAQFDTNGWNDPSEVRMFSTETPTAVHGAPGVSPMVLVSPNPTRSQTHIKFALENSADVSLKIFNTLGVTEGVLVSGKLSADKYDFIWNAAGKADGIYIYELRVGEKVEHGRIVLVK